MWVWRRLLRVAAHQRPPLGHTAIDGMYFERTQPSFHYRHRFDRAIRTLKPAVLVDSHNTAVSDIQPLIDRGMTPRLARMSPAGMRATYGVWPPTMATIRTRFVTFSETMIVTTGALLSVHVVGSRSQRAVGRLTVQQTMDGRDAFLRGETLARGTVRAPDWYREFRECVLESALYDVERTCSAL